ncbi:MAG: methionyl-tRNA formyltransferase [Synergistaceae bacterium]|nr:methionyl-tRNA formyltransferase [Synergistaceae bacterium]
MWFIGTGQFAAMCLEGLTRRGLTFTRIITGKPTVSGRGKKEHPSPVEVMAGTLGLTVTRTGKLTENQELIDALEAENPGVIFVIDFGQIIREPFLSRMCLNIHPSFLPEYRGAAPIQRAILGGHERTGVTVFRIAQEMDAGGILAQSAADIAPSDYASDMFPRLAETGCEIACDALKNPGGLTFTPQDDSLATVAPKISKAEFELKPEDPALKFVNTVRALDMSGGAWVMAGRKRVKVWRACLRNDITGGTPGNILADGGNPVMICGDFGVELQEVQAEGKRRMTGREWALGMRGKLCKL